ncbi:MAG TPA: hypothetical protein VMR81_03450 [Patescibacteria group bacterium]|nr:hypothetical protein [Patescibacteria group bacterium]
MNEVRVAEVPAAERHLDMPIEVYLMNAATNDERIVMENTFAFWQPFKNPYTDEIKDSGSTVGLESRAGGMCVHLMDGYFVTPKHVSDAYSLSDDSEVEFRDRIPDVIFDIYGTKRNIQPDLIFSNPRYALRTFDDFVIFRVDPIKYPWIQQLPRYPIISNHKVAVGRSICVGVPDLIFPLGFDEKGDPLVVDNVGRQLTVRLKENDVPIWKRKVSIEEARLHARAGEEYPSWFFGVPMTREAKGYTKGPFINNEMFISKGYSGGPLIHNGVLLGMVVEPDVEFGSGGGGYAVDIKLVFKTLRGLM